MITEKEYDVIVIGAGPAGLMAGKELKKAGVDFLIIDSKKKIGLPLRCGEGIRQDGFIELFGREKFDFVVNKTSKVEVIVNKVKRVLPVDYLILNRPDFEQWLAKPLEKHLLLDTEFRDVIREKHFMKVITNKGVFQSKLVILACGCNYHVQKKFGLIRKSPLLVPCYGGLFINQSKNIKTNTIYFYFDDENDSAIWFFPKSRSIANVGIGVVPFYRKKKLTDLFSIALKKFDLKLEKKQEFGGVFPTVGNIRRTYAKRLLVCGDAAGQVYAGCGEGIYFALKAGKLAGKTGVEAVRKNIFSRYFLRKYQIAWKKSIGEQITASKYFAGILFLGFKFKKLNYLFKIPSDKTLVNLFLYGKIPRKVKVALWLAVLMGHLNPKRTNFPWLFKFIGRRVYRKRIQKSL